MRFVRGFTMVLPCCTSLSISKGFQETHEPGQKCSAKLSSAKNWLEA